jgi:omega-6 fatty acid desaturase (delta-12 desaturase)
MRIDRTAKAEFDALPRWRRLLERFYRSPTFVGWGVYYLLQRHWSTKLVPPAYVPGALRRAAWWNAALLFAYGAALLSLLIAAPRYAVDLTSTEALLIGFVLPLFVFEIHDGFALYVQHTDPRIAWFGDSVDRNGEGRPELLSVHLRVPRLMGTFYHDTFAHPVHHLHPKIPCYRVFEAQTKLDERLGRAAVVSPFNVRWLLDTMRRCKLYDWEKKQWLDFSDAQRRPLHARRLKALHNPSGLLHPEPIHPGERIRNRISKSFQRSSPSTLGRAERALDSAERHGDRAGIR